MKRTLLILFAFTYATAASGEQFSGTVTLVHDGDTAHVKKSDGTIVKVRFVLCDAPEIDQPHGIEARDFVAGLCLNKQVTVEKHGTDDFGRTLGEIIVNGISVNKELIKEGHGWWFYHYHNDQELGKLEVAAKSIKKGLWAAEAPIYPRAWRRGARLNESTGGSDSDGGTGSDTVSPQSSVFIMAILPNPVGIDTDNETVILANSSDAEVSIDQWKLLDDDNGVFTLSGTVPAGGSRTIRLNSSLDLGNSGDTIRLRKPNGEVVQTIGYGNASTGRFVLVRE